MTHGAHAIGTQRDLVGFVFIPGQIAGRDVGNEAPRASLSWSMTMAVSSSVASGEHWFAAAGVADIRTRVAHPESNGRLERLHRTHREEGLVEAELGDYAQAVDAFTRWADYYNHRRPHSALRYLRPVGYYRGDPEARLAERQKKLVQGWRLVRLIGRSRGIRSCTLSPASQASLIPPKAA